MEPVKWKKDEISEKGGGRRHHRRQTTLAAIESLAVPLVQEVVVLADFRCVGCQQRVAQIFSRMDGETQSVMISVLEKKVTLTCTYPAVNKLHGGRQIASVFRSSWTKICPILCLLRSSCTS